MMVLRKFSILVVVLLLGGWSGSKPVLSPNEHLTSAGKKVADNDIQTCQKKAAKLVEEKMDPVLVVIDNEVAQLKLADIDVVVPSDRPGVVTGQRSEALSSHPGGFPLKRRHARIADLTLTIRI